MDTIIQLLKQGESKGIFAKTEMIDKLSILIKKGLVEVQDEKFVLSKKGEHAFKNSTCVLMQEPMVPERCHKPGSDKKVLFFLNHWNNERKLGFSVWFILVLLWVILRIF